MIALFAYLHRVQKEPLLLVEAEALSQSRSQHLFYLFDSLGQPINDSYPHGNQSQDWQRLTSRIGHRLPSPLL